MSEETTTSKAFVLPEGRLINAALFVKDVYKDPETGQEGNPRYKVELAIDPDAPGFMGEGTEEEPTVEDRIVWAAEDKWGEAGVKAFDNGDLVTPFIKGDKLAEDREERGKKGDAYKGKIVVRADTKYNKDGEDGPGGVSVYRADLTEIDPADRAEIYRGCFGIAQVTCWAYKNNRGEKCVKFYLTAFQKSRDGEKLSTGADRRSLFSKIETSKGEGGNGRTTRRTRARG